MTGWGGDRDSTDIPRITEARTAMAEAVTAYQTAHAAMLADGADMVAAMVAVISKADAMAEAWHKFTEVTGGRVMRHLMTGRFFAGVLMAGVGIGILVGAPWPPSRHLRKVTRPNRA